METKTLRPIFIMKTRSFWLGIAPALLTILDVMFAAATGDASATPVASAISTVLGWAFGWTPEQIFGVMKALAPIYAFIVAQQRSGITRPYAATPAAENEKPAAVLVKDVKAAAVEAVRNEVGEAVARRIN